EVLNIVQADEVGCHIITATNDILNKLALLGKDHSDFSLETGEMFYRDAQAAGYLIHCPSRTVAPRTVDLPSPRSRDTEEGPYHRWGWICRHAVDAAVVGGRLQRDGVRHDVLRMRIVAQAKIETTQGGHSGHGNLP